MRSADLARRLAATLLVLLGLLQPALARSVLELDAQAQPVALGDWADMRVDPEGTLQAREVNASHRWTEFNDKVPVPLPARASLWLRFTLPATPEAERWYLEIPAPALRMATLFVQDHTGGWAPLSAGTDVPVGRWPVPSRHPLLPVAVSAEQPLHYLLRIQGPPAVFREPVGFVSESYLHEREQRAAIALGCFFGLQLLLAAIMVAKALALRDRPFAHGAAAVFLLTAAQAATTGVAGLHLWPGSVLLATHAGQALGLAAMASLVHCGLQALSLAERWPRLHRAAIGATWLGTVAAAGAMAMAPQQAAILLAAWLATCSVLVIVVMAWASRRSAAHARELVLACVALAMCGVLPALHLLGAVRSSFWSQHGLQLGTVAFSLVLLNTLFARVALRRENMRRILGLERIDPATGLINRYEFVERLLRVTARSQRLRYTSAVFVVEVTNLDQLTREFGRMTPEEVPVRVARRLLSTVRDIDTVGRLGQHRFGILLEGPLADSDAAALGPRLVARCLMPFRNKPEHWVPQVKVAQALVPFGRAPANVLLENLEGLLERVPESSRKAVFTLRREQEGEPSSYLPLNA